MLDRDVIFTKVFTEIKFTASLLYADLKLLTNFISFLNDYFDNVVYDDKNNSISCNSKDKIVGYFWNNRIIIDMNDPDYQAFMNLTKETLSFYCQTFNVEQFNRVGIRFNWVNLFENFDEANKTFYDKFLPFIKDIKAPVDIGTVKSGKIELHTKTKDGKQLNIAIYPSQQHMFDVKLTPAGPQQTHKSIEGLTIDLDLFEEGKIKYDEYLMLLDVAENETSSKIQIVRHILGDDK